MAEHRTDVLIVGAGMGGIAAALAAADGGSRVLLTCELEMVGGQLTSQLVPPDEHPYVERTGRTRSYASLRDGIRAAYGGVENPGGGWVSRLCCEPAVAETVLRSMLQPHLDAGRVVLHTHWQPVRVERVGPRLTLVEFEDGSCGTQIVRPDVVVDATELGDLLPLAEVPFAIGSEGSLAHGESHAIEGGPDPAAEQSCTWVVALELTDQPGAVGQPPIGYAARRDAQPFSLTLQGREGPQPYRMFETGPAGHPPFWTYRRIRDGSVLGGNDVATINWSGNDFGGAGLVADGGSARAGAKELTRSFVHWLRTEAPRDDGGRGYPELRPASEVTGTPDGMALAPYVRESRRIADHEPITLHDIAPRPGHARAREWRDSVAVGWYHADLHRRVGHPQDAYIATSPFQVPARALSSATVENLLVGAKNICATQVAASATRLHPVEWAVGEAAGVIAATAMLAGVSPRDLLSLPSGVLGVQRTLLRRGAPIAWITDITDDDPLFVGAQLLVTHGALAEARAESLDLGLDQPMDRAASSTLRNALAALGISARGSNPTSWPDAAGAVTHEGPPHTGRRHHDEGRTR